MLPDRRKIDVQRLIAYLDEGLPQKEIAARFGVSPAAVCKAIKRSRLELALLRLTEKQRSFVAARGSGMTQQQAAAVAFDCKDLASAKAIGNDLAKKPEISAAMGAWLSHYGLHRGERARRWVAAANSINPAISLPALRETSRMGGDYADASGKQPSDTGIYVISYSSSHQPGDVLDPDQEEPIHFSPGSSGQ